MRESDRQWRIKNPARFKEIQRAYYFRNRRRILERTKIYCAAWEKRNRAKRSAQRKARYAANKEHELAVNRKWAQANRKRQTAINRIWRSKNREKVRQSSRDSYHRHIEQRRIDSRKYSAAKSRRRRAKQLANGQSDVVGIEQWISGLKKLRVVTCYYCKCKLPPADMEIDHILPISQNGKHQLSNLCVACQFCNRSKHARTPEDWIKKGQTVMNLW